MIPPPRAVVQAKPLSHVDFTYRYGDDQALQFVGEKLFATTRGSVFFVDLDTWEATPLVTGLGALGLAVDRRGDLYFVGSDTHVYRYACSE